MPQPPILPQLDWKAIFDAGRDYPTWIDAAGEPENAAKMEATRAALELAPQDAAWLAALPRRVNIVAIAEDWCGDVVRHAPVLARIAEASPNVALRFIARADRTDVFARFLTNGGEAIPKFVFLSQDWVECGNWGPMPAACRELIARGKACGDGKTARERVGALYDADPKLRIVVEELLHLIDIAATPGL